MRSIPHAFLGLLVVIVGIVSTTVTAARVDAHSGHTPGLEFQLAVLSPHPCGPGAADGKTSCLAQQYKGSFTVGVYVADISGIANSSWFEAGFTLQYGGDITSLDDPAIVWPLCLNETSSTGPGFVHAACEGTSSNYTGLVGTAGFRCNTSGGTITLVHGLSDTYVVDSAVVKHSEPGPDTLTINCVDEFTTYTPTSTRTPRPPTPTPPPAVGGPTSLTEVRSPRSSDVTLWLITAVAVVCVGLAGALWYASRRRMR